MAKVNWDWRGIDNLTREEEGHLVIKGSNKGGNIVLLSEVSASETDA